MEFHSYLFIMVFLPLVVVIYYLLQKLENQKIKICFLIGASLFWLGCQDTRSLLFLCISLSVNFCLAKLIKGKNDTVMKYKNILLCVGLFLNVGILGCVRYTEKIAFLGISFITFQQIMYLVDTYKGIITDASFSDYLFYITFFPKFIQGPIVKYDALVAGIYQKSPDNKEIFDRVGCGLYFFAIGLAKKVLLADVLAKGVNYGWEHIDSLSSAEAVIVILLFTLQIYFDFSGYSHMAIGIARILGFTLPDNFNNPYMATGITDFWARWHISLTDFLREYIYIPLGGNRKGIVRTLINIMIVYLISGVWHGAALTFLIWGAFHGLASCIDRLIRPFWKKVPVMLRWICTFGFVNFAWIFFRAPSIESAWCMIKKALAFEQFSTSEGLKECFHVAEISCLCGRFEGFNEWLTMNSGKPMYVFILTALFLMFFAKDRVDHFKPTIIRSIIAGVCLFSSIISLSSVVGFIYENF